MTDETAALPDYDSLPIRPDAPPGSSWGLWGERDVLGTLNLLDEDAVLRGVAAAKRGVVFPLNLALSEPDPPLSGRSGLVHEITWIPGEIGHDEELSGWNTQSSSQWDGFRHIRHLQYGFYNGVADDEHGVHHWAVRGIVGRAVLVDIGRHRESVGKPLDMTSTDPIEPQEVLDALEAQGTEVLPGDVLLLRTGWLEWYKDQGPTTKAAMAERYQTPGLRAGPDTSRVLWDLHVAAVASDNPALEAWPPAKLATSEQRSALKNDPLVSMEISLHFSLLPLLGMPIGELWDLGDLAADCDRDRRYEALLTSSPLNLVGGVASPPNALAVK